jgi:hypothetical protein
MSTSPTLSDYVQNALPTWLGGSPVTANETAINVAQANAQIAAVASSPGAQVTVNNPLQSNDNLINGNSYVFIFSAQAGATAASIAADIAGQAPAFMTMVQVALSSSGDFNVQFTYEGDNTDVVSDVASSIVSAGMQVNQDQLSFVNAVNNSTVGALLAPTIAQQQQASITEQGNLANATNAAAAKSDTSQLTTWLLWAAIGVGLFLFLAPKFMAATTPRVSVST